MSASSRSPQGVLAVVLALAVLIGCGPAADAVPGPATGPGTGRDAGVTPGQRNEPVTYRLGVVRSGAVVVVIEATGPVDAVGPALVPALRRAVPRGPSASPGPTLDGVDWTRVTGGRLRPERSTEAPRPLVDCVSVTPWSAADTFLGVAYEDPARPAARLSEFVLRYPTAALATEGALRIRHQFEDCPDGGSTRIRALEQRLRGSGDEAFVGEQLVQVG